MAGASRFIMSVSGTATRSVIPSILPSRGVGRCPGVGLWERSHAPARRASEGTAMKRNSAKAGTGNDPELWVGVNFWARSGGPRMWTNYDPAIVREELATMREHGMTVTRSFLYWPDAMPPPDALDEPVMANFERFLDLHAELGMTTIPTFIVGHMSGENWDPAWRDGRDIFEDVWFVARQA